MEMKIISRDTLKSEASEKRRSGIVPIREEMINLVTPSMNLRGSNVEKFDAAERAEMVSNAIFSKVEMIKQYGSAFDMPRTCHTISKQNGKQTQMSVREMIKRGVFMSSNTIPADWQTLWDALRVDISIAKASLGTVRENFYNIMNMPNSDKVFKAVEFYPYGVVFEENNGEGQAITQGETLGGQVETIEHILYAAGFTWTLLAELFNGSIDMNKIADAVLLGYNAKQDDLSISPITAFTYSGVSGSQTSAATLSGANRQELLYLTLENAIDDLADRTDPVTGRDIMADDLRILAHPEDARHISRVLGGLPSVNERSYPSISEISKIVAYNGETIPLRAKTVTYAGVTKGKAYLVKPNRYMNIGIKRGLTLEVDRTPDVKTLAREERAWYFAEGQQTTGIASFVQEITLPTW
jgi:hypothetical protein